MKIDKEQWKWTKVCFDQCGVVMYLDSENWLKGSIEYENDEFQPFLFLRIIIMLTLYISLIYSTCIKLIYGDRYGK